MPPRTLASLATVLSAARDADAALTLLQHEAWDIERSAQVALFLCDSRRQLITERLTPVAGGIGRTPMNVAVDHLPAPIRRTLASGSAVADFGTESDDYLKLLGLAPQQGGGILSVRGLTLDGEICGFVAVYEPRRRFGNRVIERLAPAIDLFALAFERIAEHDARFEAVQALEELTRNIHSEYNSAVRGLKAELDQARSLNGSPDEAAAQRIAELERAIAAAADDAHARGARLTAVEDQIARAVSRLEEAHVELHSQGELARNQGRTLYEIERALDEGGDPEEIVRRVRAAFSPRS
ncbi:MAG TPA: hypothetical protein VES88_06080 [Gemmatimonadaceae bacterium]|nr:hypothetical protein [Gemmatimonadaceae bacterium]